MQYYDKYIVTSRLRKRVLCGDVNLPYGTECFTVDFGNSKAIACDKGILSAVTSQDAYEFFSQNDDGMGSARGAIVHKIVSHLRKLNQQPKQKEAVWDKIWNDPICLKYKRQDHIDTWLWNYDFYNASLFDLQYIAKLVGAK